MKRCPECRRDYYDDTLLYCLDDGSRLLDGPATATELAPSRAKTKLNAELDHVNVPAGSSDLDEGSPTEILPGSKLSEALTQEMLPAAKLGDSGQIGQLRRSPKPQRILAVVLAAAIISAAGFLGYRYLTSSQQIRSVAVMPISFENGNQEMEYLSDGMTESLIGSLSQIDGLNVKARATVFRFKGREGNITQIGKELDVQAVLTGRMVQRGEELTLFLSLVNPSGGDNIWSKSYSRRLTNLIALQSEIAKDVADQLRKNIARETNEKITKNYTANAEAFQAYLRGKFHWNRYSEAGFSKAIEHFNEAIRIDPNYALAYSGLADSHTLLAVEAQRNPHEVMPQAKIFADRAVTLDPVLSEGYASLGMYHIFYSFDWGAAEAAFNRAIEINPKNQDARHFRSHFFQGMGRNDEALQEIKAALESDPLSLIVNTELGWAYYYARDYEQAISILHRTRDLDPSFFVLYLPLAQAHLQRKEYDEAISELKKAEELSEGHPWIVAELACAYALSGKKAEARQILEKLAAPGDRFVEPYLIANVHIALGDKDKGIEWLEKAYTARSNWLLWAKTEPKLDPVRGDARFANLLKKMGLPE